MKFIILIQLFFLQKCLFVYTVLKAVRFIAAGNCVNFFSSIQHQLVPYFYLENVIQCLIRSEAKTSKYIDCIVDIIYILLYYWSAFNEQIF